jgi:hypothetical protein
LLSSLFNGKPQASMQDFAYACGSPLNENAESRVRQQTNNPNSSEQIFATDFTSVVDWPLHYAPHTQNWNRSSAKACSTGINPVA